MLLPRLRPVVLKPQPRMLFAAMLQASLVPETALGSGTPTYTRATTATFLDWEGVVRTAISGEPRFVGARRVRNCLTNSQTCSAVGSCTLTTGQTDPLGGTAATKAVYAAAGTGHRFVFSDNVGCVAGTPFAQSLWLRGELGTEQIKIWDGNSATTSAITLTTSWKRYAQVATAAGVSAAILVYANTGTPTVYAAFAQLEYTPGQSNTAPGEYVSYGVVSAPYHGAGVDGVKYFTTLNGNTVASNVVTEATGAAITSANGSALTTDTSGPFGYLAEGARTNLALRSETLENAAWSASNITIAANSVAAPDGATTADTLTASAGNGTLIQDLGTIASAVKTFSIYLKRLTGTGNIDLTLDGGSTWTTKTITSSWARYDITQTLADPDCGIRIVTNADAVYAWGAQVEAASFASAYIATTTVAVTRNFGSATYVTSGNLTTNDATIYLEWTPSVASQGAVYLWGSYVDANNSTAILHDGTNIIFRKRIGGSNTDAVKALAYAAGTAYKIAARASSATGQDIFVNGAVGTNDPTTTAMQLGTTTQLAADGNSASGSCGFIRNRRNYNRALTDAQIGAF